MKDNENVVGGGENSLPRGKIDRKYVTVMDGPLPEVSLAETQRRQLGLENKVMSQIMEYLESYE